VQIISVALLAIDVASREEMMSSVQRLAQSSVSGSLDAASLLGASATSVAAGAPIATKAEGDQSFEARLAKVLPSMDRLSGAIKRGLEESVPPLLPESFLLLRAEGGVPMLSLTLLYVTAGYALCQLLFAVMCMFGEALAAHSPSLRVFRSGWLFVLAMLTAVCALMTVTQGHLQPLLGGVFRASAFEAAGVAVRAWMPFGVGEWPESWHVALATSALIALCCFATQYLAQSSPLLAPLVADVVLRRPEAMDVSASPTTSFRCVALTFNGAPDPAVSESGVGCLWLGVWLFTGAGAPVPQAHSWMSHAAAGWRGQPESRPHWRLSHFCVCPYAR
jgi:hypothetical protein